MISLAAVLVVVAEVSNGELSCGRVKVPEVPMSLAAALLAVVEVPHD